MEMELEENPFLEEHLKMRPSQRSMNNLSFYPWQTEERTQMVLSFSCKIFHH